MRVLALLPAVAAVLVAGHLAAAQAPERPTGNFGGGALVPRPKSITGPGNVIIALRALPERRLEIEATVRGRCAGGDVVATTSIDGDGRFSAEGSATAQPRRGRRVTTRYTLAGSFTGARAAEGTVSATLRVAANGRTRTCRTGDVAWSARRPTGDVGRRGARRRARYFGVTEQRGVSARRPIVLRVSGDGRRISRALFGQHVRCRDGKRSIGIEAPRTEIAIGREGRVTDRERDEIDNGATVTHVDDRFTATLGHDGAKGTFSLSDRTVDKATGNVVQSCRSGRVRWVAAP